MPHRMPEPIKRLRLSEQGPLIMAVRLLKKAKRHFVMRCRFVRATIPPTVITCLVPYIAKCSQNLDLAHFHFLRMAHPLCLLKQLLQWSNKSESCLSLLIEEARLETDPLEFEVSRL
jgi:hypothetical protein